MPDLWRALRPRLPASLREAEWAAAIVSRYVGRGGLRPLPGADAVMQKLAEAGLRQVCVSNSGRSIVDANLRALGIDDLLDFSISLAFGRVQTLFNCIGVNPNTDALDIPPEEWAQVMAVNVNGQFHTAQAVARNMAAARLSPSARTPAPSSTGRSRRRITTPLKPPYGEVARGRTGA
jgi:NAD(P)-dependent dehydrogenase (short-subunit alcohol dehydrogenase family)